SRVASCAMDLLEEAAPSYRLLFTLPGFTRLVASMLLGRIGGTMVQLILVLFALDRYHSATVAGAVAFLAVAPGLVVSPIAGALLAAFGPEVALLASAGVFAVAMLVATGIHDPTERTQQGRLLADAWAGLVYVVRNPTLRGLALAVSTNNVAWGLFFIALP